MFLDPAVDAALTKRAEDEGITKGMLVRRYIREGLNGLAELELSLEAPPSPVPEPVPTGQRILRSIYLEDQVDGMLASRASNEGVHRSTLIGRFIVEGLARPPKPQAVTRLHEVTYLKESYMAYLHEAERAAKLLFEPVERIRQEILEHLDALRTCSPEDETRLREELKDVLKDR